MGWGQTVKGSDKDKQATQGVYRPGSSTQASQRPRAATQVPSTSGPSGSGAYTQPLGAQPPVYQTLAPVSPVLQTQSKKETSSPRGATKKNQTSSATRQQTKTATTRRASESTVRPPTGSTTRAPADSATRRGTTVVHEAPDYATQGLSGDGGAMVRYTASRGGQETTSAMSDADAITFRRLPEPAPPRGSGQTVMQTQMGYGVGSTKRPQQALVGLPVPMVQPQWAHGGQLILRDPTGLAGQMVPAKQAEPPTGLTMDVRKLEKMVQMKDLQDQLNGTKESPADRDQRLWMEREKVRIMSGQLSHQQRLEELDAETKRDNDSRQQDFKFWQDGQDRQAMRRREQEEARQRERELEDKRELQMMNQAARHRQQDFAAMRGINRDYYDAHSEMRSDFRNHAREVSRDGGSVSYGGL